MVIKFNASHEKKKEIFTFDFPFDITNLMTLVLSRWVIQWASLYETYKNNSKE